jgi:hypothetical protein
MRVERPPQDCETSRRITHLTPRTKKVVLVGAVASGGLVVRLLAFPGARGVAPLAGVGFHALNLGLGWVGGAGLGVAGAIQLGIGWVGGAGLGVAGTL